MRVKIRNYCAKINKDVCKVSNLRLDIFIAIIIKIFTQEIVYMFEIKNNLIDHGVLYSLALVSSPERNKCETCQCPTYQ